MTGSEFRTAITEALERPPANQALAMALLDPNGDRPRFAIGRNEQAAALAPVLRLDGLIDDFAPAGSTWNGLPVTPAAQVPAGAAVVNCSTSISPVAVERRLRAAGIADVLSIADVIHAAPGQLDWPWFVRQQREDWRVAQEQWADIFLTLEDGESRQTLLDVLRYRLTADLRHMRAYEVRIEDQYFEDFLGLRAEVFVDAGGYDGDTTEEFCRRCPDYRRVHLFEPSPRNLAAAKVRLAGCRDIAFWADGLSDCRGSATFDAEAGSASSVSSGEGETVRMTTLDEAVAEPVSFIKMDLEGWEMKALAGCERHIREDRPKLAIAVYHRAADFRDVHRYVRSIHPDYKVYLRHYTQGWSETVMFFV